MLRAERIMSVDLTRSQNSSVLVLPVTAALLWADPQQVGRGQVAVPAIEQ